MTDETDILYQRGAYWVLREPRCYRIMRDTSTHAIVIATVGRSYGLAYAIAECDRRAGG